MTSREAWWIHSWWKFLNHIRGYPICPILELLDIANCNQDDWAGSLCLTGYLCRMGNIGHVLYLSRVNKCMICETPLSCSQTTIVSTFVLGKPSDGFCSLGEMYPVWIGWWSWKHKNQGSVHPARQKIYVRSKQFRQDYWTLELHMRKAWNNEPKDWIEIKPSNNTRSAILNISQGL